MPVALASTEAGMLGSSCIPPAAVHTNGRSKLEIPEIARDHPTILDPSPDTARGKTSGALGLSAPRSWKAPASHRKPCGANVQSPTPGNRQNGWLGIQKVPTTTEPSADTAVAELAMPPGPRPSG